MFCELRLQLKVTIDVLPEHVLSSLSKLRKNVLIGRSIMLIGPVQIGTRLPPLPYITRLYPTVVSPRHMIKTGIIGPHMRTLELPLLVRFDSLLLLYCLKYMLRVLVSTVCLVRIQGGNFGPLCFGSNNSSSYHSGKVHPHSSCPIKMLPYLLIKSTI